MKNLNLLEACSIVGDAPILRMSLASNRETMSSLMPHLKDCLILLRARLPWFRITRGTFYTLPVIPNTKLGEFTIGSLTLALIMLLCIRVRHLVLGRDGNGNPIPDSPRGIPLLGDGDVNGENFSPNG
jgi:hypothetical protein